MRVRGAALCAVMLATALFCQLSMNYFSSLSLHQVGNVEVLPVLGTKLLTNRPSVDNLGLSRYCRCNSRLMGDHLALLVDRLLTESTLEAAIGKQMVDLQPETVPIEHCRGGVDGGNSASKVVECRICQEEDWDTSMEAPCACCGSLKYAHRKCIQRWCNEKGDTICEICLQQFRPGYTAPRQLFHYGSIPMNFRGNWEIARQDLDDARIITMMPTERDFLDSYDDYLPIRTRSSTLCCRTIAVIFLSLLILRHTLPLMIGGNGEYSLALFALLVLRTAGILFPILVMVRALASFHRRRRQQENQDTYVSSSESEEEEEEDTSSAQSSYSQSRSIPVY